MITLKSNLSITIVDPVINLQKPIGGFIPVFTDSAADVNRILYSAPKANEPDEAFIEDVLNAEESVTAKEDKIIFEEVVRDAIGHELNTGTLANIYQEVNRVVEEDEEDSARLDYKDIESILKHSGIEDVNSDKLATAFSNVIDDTQYELKAKISSLSTIQNRLKLTRKLQILQSALRICIMLDRFTLAENAT